MSYTLSLGTLGSPPPKRAGSGKDVFRLAVLADFSGRASRGALETGDELASRKPITVDVDNLDAVVKRLGINLTLPIGAEDAAIEIPIASMDDFHPDQIFDNVELFGGISALRQRLKSSSTFAKAAAEVQSWLGLEPESSSPKRQPARGAVIPVGGKLSDFACLMGQSSAPAAEASVNELLKRVVGPHVVPAKDPKQDKLLATVDAALSDTMLKVLHHPDFQSLEATWRGLEFLVRRLETGANFKIVIYDISAEEFAADLSSADDLQTTGLYKLLVEQPQLDAQQGPISAIVANYFFEQTPPHAELLGRMARIAGAAQAPFLAAIGPDVLQKQREEDIHPLILESWGALRSLPESAYLGLTVPRFMLRNPYGERTDPIDRFDFEEFSPRTGLKGMLWSSGAYLVGLLMGQSFLKVGSFAKINLGGILSAGDMPYYFFEDADGDQTALPCTERMLSVALSAHVTKQHFMPLLAIKGRPELRLGGFLSVLGKPIAGPWGAAPLSAPSSGKSDDAPAKSSSASSSDSPASDSPAAASSSDSSGDSDLDALLASLGGDSSSSSSDSSEKKDDSSELDPDLAALLADL